MSDNVNLNHISSDELFDFLDTIPSEDDEEIDEGLLDDTDVEVVGNNMCVYVDNSVEETNECETNREIPNTELNPIAGSSRLEQALPDRSNSNVNRKNSPKMPYSRRKRTRLTCDYELLPEQSDLDDGSEDEFRQTDIVADDLQSSGDENAISLLESEQSKSASSKSRKVSWRKRKLQNIPQTFCGNTDLPPEILQLETPYQYFNFFFDDALMDRIVEESVRFSTQKDPSRPFPMSVNYLKNYIGICLITSVVSIGDVRLYWNDTIGPEIVRKTMTVNHFERIRSNLHFNDNDSPTAGNDKLHKLRPVVDALLTNFRKVPYEEGLSVDEQICATKTRHHMKQYLPLKPHKWGFKIWCLCGVSAFCYNFEIYTGSENSPEKRLPNEPDLGASSNTVVRLVRFVPRNVFHKVYFDNYYTSLPLLSYLAKNGMHALGTVRLNRIPGCKIPTKLEAKKLPRGSMGEFVTIYQGVEVSNTYWKDNKIVALASTFVGTDPIEQVDRYDRRQKAKIKVPCPAVIKVYNAHMGGVDLLDSLIGRYKIRMRSRKWYMRLFYHLVDISVVNAWLLYRRCHPEQEVMKLADFRVELAVTLCKLGSSESSKRGRPSGVQVLIEKQRKKPNAAPVPPKEVRLDNVCHFPKWNPTRLRCKLPACSAQTFVVCDKCNVSLCFNKDKNCFFKFHYR